MISVDSELRLMRLANEREPFYDPQSGLPIIHGLRQVHDALRATPFSDEIPGTADVDKMTKHVYREPHSNGERTVRVYSLDTTNNKPVTVILDSFSLHHERSRDTVAQTVTIIDGNTGEAKQVLPTSETVYQHHLGPESTQGYTRRITGVEGPFQTYVFGPKVPVRRIGHPQIAA